MENKETPFEVRCVILADLWMNYRKDDDFQDFLEYNDVGLPLAFMLAEGIVAANDKSRIMVDETFDLFLAALGIEDKGFEDLDEMLVG